MPRHVRDRIEQVAMVGTVMACGTLLSWPIALIIAWFICVV